jgi:hypothetical protein
VLHGHIRGIYIYIYIYIYVRLRDPLLLPLTWGHISSRQLSRSLTVLMSCQYIYDNAEVSFNCNCQFSPWALDLDARLRGGTCD